MATYLKPKTKRAIGIIITLVLLLAAMSAFFATETGDSTANETSSSSSTSAAVVTNTIDPGALVYDWDESLAPNYYYVAGPAQIDTVPLPAGDIFTSALDELGRSGYVKATVTYDMVEESAGWRETFSKSANPSGWGHNEEVNIELPDGSIYHGWFWNRSHLLADSLGGHAVRENVITGTRMQNVGSNNSREPGGMAFTETEARNWLYDNHDGTVYYKATPVYFEDELVPRSVIVDIETSDKSISQHVIVYNFAKGYTIDYTNGTFSQDK